MKFLYFLFVLSVLGCVGEVDDPSDSVEVQVDGERADRAGEVRLRNQGLSTWIKPQILMPTSVQESWRIFGRFSRNIESMSAQTHEKDLDLIQLSKRKFELRLDWDSFQDALIHDVFLKVKTSAGTHTLRLEMEPTFDKGKGSSYIYPYRRVRLISNNGAPVFRATVTTRKDARWLEGWNDDDSEPESTKLNPRKFYLDFPSGYLTSAASPYSDGLFLNMETMSGRRYEREINIGLRVKGLGLTKGDGTDVWPAAECDRAGNVKEELACGPLPTHPLVQTFARDFRSFIIRHYRANEADILSKGGVPRTSALLNVDSADIVELEESDRYDLKTHRIMAHPDIVFPGSTELWIGVYSRTNDSLISIEKIAQP